MSNIQIQYIVVEGTVSDGFDFHGPFDYPEDAIGYADSKFDDWNIVELIPVEDYTKYSLAR